MTCRNLVELGAPLVQVVTRGSQSTHKVTQRKGSVFSRTFHVDSDFHEAENFAPIHLEPQYDGLNDLLKLKSRV
jgi:hypothetical protein